MSEFESTIYGPVESWRFGQSLGVDLLFQTSICSFNCVYCQLGHIQNITAEKKVYVSTEKVLSDYDKFLETKKEHDVITYSGNGEPTLASNLEEIIDGIRARSPEQKQMVLTNATMLTDEDVLRAVCKLDSVIVKFDAGDEETFQRINRPAEGVTLQNSIEGVRALKKVYKGSIEFQIMIMPTNIKTIDQVIPIIKEINPDVVQLNRPKRPYPLDWELENRGNHTGNYGVEIRKLKQADDELFDEFVGKVEEKYTGLIVKR